MIGTILATAGISIFDKLINDHGQDLVEKGIEKVTGIKLEDKKELSDEEIKIIKNNQENILRYDFENLKLQLEHEAKMESEISKRWESDNKSDSRFAKLIRPVLVAYLVAVCTILAIIDGNLGQFTIKEVWVTLFTTLTITAVGGYFTLRTYEKRTGTSKWNK